MGIILTIGNHKGGAAKTTTAVSLGSAIARTGKQALIIDNDPQANASKTCLQTGDDPFLTMYDIYDNRAGMGIDSGNIARLIRQSKQKNLFILPNERRTADVELEIRLAKAYPDSLYYLRNAVRQHAIENYDVTLIDCLPSLNLFVRNALVASDAVLVPVEVGSQHSKDGLDGFLDEVRKMQVYNSDLQFLRLVISRYNRQLIISKANIENIRNTIDSEFICETMIPENTALQQAEGLRLTIHQLDDSCPAALAFTRLEAEIADAIRLRQKR